jgi:hypothetical protein
MNRKSLALTGLMTAALALASSATASELSPDLETRLEARFEAVRTEHPNAFEALDPNDYRHPWERRVVGELLADPKIKELMPKALEMAEEFNQAYHRQHLLNGILVSETQFPWLYQMAQENAEALQMKKGFKLYVMNSAQMNAYTWSIDQDNYGVALFSGILNGMTREELRFVLAHEMGHVKSKHILTTILIQLYAEKHGDLPEVFQAASDEAVAEKVELPGTYLAEELAHLPKGVATGLARRLGGGVVKPLHISAEAEANFKRLQQAAEYSSDRAGVVGTGDREKSMMGLVKLASGHVGGMEGFDLDQYLEQIEAVLADMDPSELEGVLAQEGGHAFTLMRVAEAERFFESDEYANAARTQGASVFRRVVSAYFQSSQALQAAQEALKDFQEADDREEINSLKRRMKMRELSKAVAARQAPEAALRPLVTETISEVGLRSENAAFEMLMRYAQARKDGAPFGPVASELVEQLQFELQQPDLTPAEKAELERKLAKAKALPDVGDEDEDEDEDEAAE